MYIYLFRTPIRFTPAERRGEDIPNMCKYTYIFTSTYIYIYICIFINPERQFVSRKQNGEAKTFQIHLAQVEILKSHPTTQFNNTIAIKMIWENMFQQRA